MRAGRMRTPLLLLVVAAAVAAVVMLMPSGREQVAGEARLVIVSPHSAEARSEFEQAFEDWSRERLGYPVTVEWLDQGGTLQAIHFVDDQFERTPGGINVDLFFGGGVDPYLHFAEGGLLSPCELPDEVLEPIPRVHGSTEVYDEQLRWFGACLGGFGILYSKPVLERLGLPEPKAWADLGRPGFFSWVASADPRMSGSMYMAYEIMMQAYGWEEGWAHAVRLGANCRSFTSSASDVPAAVRSGDAACGMAIDTYGLTAVAQAGPERLGFVLPEGLTVINPDAIAMLKGAPHPELAKLFIEFVLTEPGQRLWVMRAGAEGGPRKFSLYRMSVIPGFAERLGGDAAVSTDPFAFEGGFEFDIRKKNERRTVLAALLGACIVDTHDDLAKAWKVLKDRPGDPGLKELLSPPLAEQELMDLVAKWQDAEFRNDTVSRWASEARDRYRRVAGG